jgi:hypothetical protein
MTCNDVHVAGVKQAMVCSSIWMVKQAVVCNGLWSMYGFFMIYIFYMAYVSYRLYLAYETPNVALHGSVLLYITPYGSYQSICSSLWRPNGFDLYSLYM